MRLNRYAMTEAIIRVGRGVGKNNSLGLAPGVPRRRPEIGFIFSLIYPYNNILLWGFLFIAYILSKAIYSAKHR